MLILFLVFVSNVLGDFTLTSGHICLDNWGNDWGQVTSESSVEDCQSRCLSSSVCSGFSFRPSYSSDNCVVCTGNATPLHSISSWDFYLAPPPVDCAGYFGEWSSCSVTCGAGSQTRVFFLTTMAAFGGNDCISTPTEQSCGSESCVVTVTSSLNPGQCGSLVLTGSFDENGDDSVAAPVSAPQIAGYSWAGSTFEFDSLVLNGGTIRLTFASGTCPTANVDIFTFTTTDLASVVDVCSAISLDTDVCPTSILSCVKSGGYRVTLIVDPEPDPARDSEGWGVKQSGRYCLNNWSEDWNARITGSSVSACKALCLSAGCPGISFRTTNECILCTAATELGEYPLFDFYRAPSESEPPVASPAGAPEADPAPEAAPTPEAAPAPEAVVAPEAEPIPVSTEPALPSGYMYVIGQGTCDSICTAAGSTCIMDPLYTLTAELCTSTWETTAGADAVTAWDKTTWGNTAAGGWDDANTGQGPCCMEGNGRLWYLGNKDAAGNGEGSGYLKCNAQWGGFNTMMCACVEPESPVADPPPVETPVFQWFKGDSSDGSDATAIVGAQSHTYSPLSSDIGSYIFLEVSYAGSTTRVKASNLDAAFGCTGGNVGGEPFKYKHSQSRKLARSS
eukprot:TRINITY_DN10461_c1_g1_i6.p1 TRINITY_DN10461_c1_g1~~TRINITY_DN10461_c1_g1_i6.p1  ORF type:complete len:638 (-),score=149.66 TRINITY_DN10461_c1_g1_i6:93-1952(-)